MTLKKSVKEIFPVPSLSTSPIIFLISSFFGSNPRALMATWQSGQHREPDKHVTMQRCYSFFSPGPFYLELLDIDVSRCISVKQLKGFSDLLLLLLSQLWFGACLLAGRGHRTLQGWPLGTGRLVGTQERKYKKNQLRSNRYLRQGITFST